MDEKGNINKKNYVDVERLKKVKLEGGDKPDTKLQFNDPPQADNVETLETNVTR